MEDRLGLAYWFHKAGEIPCVPGGGGVRPDREPQLSREQLGSKMKSSAGRGLEPEAKDRQGQN